MGKTLWDIAVEQHKENEEAKNNKKDSVLLLAGNKNGGKSLLCYKFLERSETPKSTLALEYVFGRRNKGIETGKEICHIWELGGGTSFLKLLEIPITPESLRNLSVVLVLDLSKPEELWYTMETILQAITKSINSALNSASNSDLKSFLNDQTKSRIPENHEDSTCFDPFPVPLLIIGTKYDLFQLHPGSKHGFIRLQENMALLHEIISTKLIMLHANIGDMTIPRAEEFDKKKLICKCLRYVAHSKLASLLFVSNKSETLVAKARASISSMVFGTSCSKTSIFDHSKPIYICAGADSFQSIGSFTSLNVENKSGPKSIDEVKKIFCSHFPQEKVENKLPPDPAADPHFKEPDIDNLRAQKKKELMEYKKKKETKKKPSWE